MKTLTTLLVIGMFLMPAALADDADDVKAEILDLFAALRAQDGNAYFSHHIEGFTSFGANGSLLGANSSLADSKKGMNEAFAAGLRANLQPRNIEVKVYGNTAVATAYIVGTRTTPDGQSRQTTERSTQVWIKQGGQWKEVHYHASPLRLPQ